MRGRWSSLSPHSPIRSTPRAAFRSLRPSAQSSPRTALTAFTAIRRSTPLRSMLAGSGSSTRSTAWSKAFRLTPTSATILRRLCSAPAKSSPSIRTDARSFLSACGARRHHQPHHLRRSWRKVSDVGAGALRNSSRGGPPKGARPSQITRRGASRKRRARGSTGMMAGRGRNSSAAGGPARHIPVMLSEVLEALEPKAGEIIIDGTFGAGGYTEAILEAADCKRASPSTATPRRFAWARRWSSAIPGRLVTVHARFSRDAGHRRTGRRLAPSTASCSISASPRCRSMRPSAASPSCEDGPLDMRMGRQGHDRERSRQHAVGAKSLPTSSSRSARRARSRAIARAIVARRRRGADPDGPGELAEIVARVLGRRRDETKHPATRTFQALRLYLNDELGELARGLERRRAPAEDRRPAGRRHLSFAGGPHRQALLRQPKRAGPPRGLAPSAGAGSETFAPSFRLLNRRPVSPIEGEIAANPRARSARLRAGERTDAPASRSRPGCLGVPRSRLPVGDRPLVPRVSPCCVSSISVSCLASLRSPTSSMR